LRKKRVAAHALYKEARVISFFYCLRHTFTIPRRSYFGKPSVGFALGVRPGRGTSRTSSSVLLGYKASLSDRF
jgi:hypothetical protein